MLHAYRCCRDKNVAKMQMSQEFKLSRNTAAPIRKLDKWPFTRYQINVLVSTCPATEFLLVLFTGGIAGGGFLESDEAKRATFVLHFVEGKL